GPPSQRISDDIRCDFYLPAEFERRFEARFGELIRTLDQHKDNEKLKRQIIMAKNLIIDFKAFTLNQWFFDVTNTLALDDAAPEELKSELKSGLKEGMDWHRYMVCYASGVHRFILGEEVAIPYGM
ncbi:hypothetical protein BX616_008608, partial [Lobosporangium transversale]